MNALTPILSEKSIVVLPFMNMSSDPENEYFSDGITEEIINALTLVEGLKVIARTSSFAFKNKNIDVRAIGSQLGVGTVLEGSVRKAHNRVRITAQLINANDGTHFWSKNFDRELEDIFALQDEVSLLIADQIRENFGHLEIPSFPVSVPTRNMDAFNLVLKGNYFLKRKDFDDIKRALKFFKEAIELDPNYSSAYAALGETYLHVAGFGMMATKEAHDLARLASEKAVELDKHNAKGHKVLAYIKLFYDWNWKGALESYQTAVKCGLPDQNEFITYYYIFIEEDFERAIEVSKKVVETDPLHVIAHWQLGLTYYFARKFDDAITAFNASLELDPNFAESLRFRGLVKGCQGEYNQGLTDINKALVLSNGEGNANIDLLMVKILMGKKKEALTALKSMKFVDSSDPASLYSLLNMPSEANHSLEKAYEERSVMMVSLKNFWVWDNLQDNAEFKAMFKRMNFPPSIANKNTLAPVNSSDTVSNSLLSPSEIAYYLQQLEQLFNEEKIYTDSSLTLRELASKINMHSNKLSWLLNEQIGKNFNEYINTYRLEAFKEHVLNPNNKHLTILAIAYESGFNSKSVFNAFFKNAEGVSPSAWVKSQQH